MTINPFHPEHETTAGDFNREPDAASSLRSKSAELKHASTRNVRRFINRVCLFAALFLALTFCVLREIQHNHELYQMSRKVSASEAQARSWQEKFRLEQAHEAQLKSTLQSQSEVPRTPQVTNAGFASSH